MNNTVQTLVKLTAQLRHERVTEEQYLERHRTVIRRTILSWASDPLLGMFYRRLLVYCDADEPQPSARRIVHRTHEYMVGNIDLGDYVRELKWEFPVLDRRNSVASIIGIRARLGSDPYYLAPIIAPRTPIDPNVSYKSNFKTTVEAQRFARVEVYKGDSNSVGAPNSEWLCGKRFNLPRDLPKGTRVIVNLERTSETRLLLTVNIPERDYTHSLPDDEGFAFLTPVLEDSQGFDEFLNEEWSKVLDKSVRSCSNFLTNFGDFLPDQYLRDLLEGVCETAKAFEKRDIEAVQSAFKLLFESLSKSLDASLVFTAETFLAETSAPADITNEFMQLAQVMLGRSEDKFAGSRSERDRVFALMNRWANLWRRSAEQIKLEPEDEAHVSILFGLQNTLRHLVETTDSFANGANFWIRLETTLELAKELYETSELDNYQRTNLKYLFIEADKVLAEQNEAAAGSILNLLIHNLQGAYMPMVFLVLDRLAQASLLPPEIRDKVTALRELLQRNNELDMEELAQVLALWSNCYVAWTKSGLVSPNKEMQHTRLAIEFELLDMLADLVLTTNHFVRANSRSKVSGIRRAFSKQYDAVFLMKSGGFSTAESMARNLDEMEKAEQSVDEDNAETALVNLLRDLQPNLESVVAFTAEAILEVTSVPEDMRKELIEIISLLKLEAARTSNSAKARIRSLVNRWNREWRASSPGKLDPDKQTFIEVLSGLLKTFVDPKSNQKEFLDKQLWPKLRAVDRWGELFQRSSRFDKISEESQNIVKGHFEAIKDLLILHEQEAQHETQILARGLISTTDVALPDEAYSQIEQWEKELPPYAKELVDKIKLRTAAKQDDKDLEVFNMLLEPDIE